jgi:transposase
MLLAFSKKGRAMRGADVMQESLFVMKTLNDFVPTDHPLRAIREILNVALDRMDEHFAAMYSAFGRESIAPEKLMRALVLQVLYGLRSERLLVEQLGYNLLYRWFVGLAIDDPVWDHSTFSKNRDRLIEQDVAKALFTEVLSQAKAKGLLSEEHFSVDGTLIRAWASHKSFVPKDGPPPPQSGSKTNPEVDFRGEQRSNATHQSTTDADARLYRKSSQTAAIPCYMGHALMENHNGLVIDEQLTHATGTAEREAALAMLAEQPGSTRKTVGADKAYDQAPFVEGCREINVTPHVAQNTIHRSSAIDARTTRHPGYRISLTIRKLLETVFADVKQHGGLHQTKLRGIDKVSQAFTLAMTVVNLRRLPKLFARPASG